MVELSSAELIELRRWAQAQRPGQHRRPCPHCSPTRRKKNEPCLDVHCYDEHFVYKCWHCQVEGGARYEESKPRRNPVRDIVPLSTAGVDYLKNRGISTEIISRFALREANAYFRNLGSEARAIIFPYVDRSITAGEKARAIKSKEFTCSRALRTPFGAQLLDMSDNDTLTICEGEIDCLSLATAGIENCISAPNGASTFRRLNEYSTDVDLYGFLYSVKEQVDAAKRIVIATDDDKPGEAFGEEIARRLGRARCWKVKYPTGCHDSNDVLTTYGVEALVQAWDDAEPWPVAGLYEASAFFEKSEELYTNGFAAKVSTGIPNVDELYSPSPGLLTVVTGIPSMGKTNFVNQLMVNVAKTEGAVSLICSFECEPPVMLGKLSEMLLRKHFFEYDDIPGERMTLEEYRSIQPFLLKHFKYIHEDIGTKADLKGIIERIKTAVLRWGVRYVVIDPYNYVRRDVAFSETDWVDEMLSELMALARSMDLHIWFIAHPRKLEQTADGTYNAPGGYSISGSAAWFNKPDFGVTIHIPDPNAMGRVEFHVWKVRHTHLGKRGKCDLTYFNTEHFYDGGNGVNASGL